MTKPRTAYDDGHDAALRVGRYSACADVPENPHPKGTSDHKEWNAGFDDGDAWVSEHGAINLDYRNSLDQK